MEGSTIAYSVTNTASVTCVLDGYMLPVWTNVSGAPEPFAGQRAMAGHALTGAGAPTAEPAAVQLAPEGAAGFVVRTTTPPGAYVPPGDADEVPVPQSHRQAKPDPQFVETPLVPAAGVEADYCESLNGSSTCVQP